MKRLIIKSLILLCCFSAAWRHLVLKYYRCTKTLLDKDAMIDVFITLTNKLNPSVFKRVHKMNERVIRECVLCVLKACGIILPLVVFPVWTAAWSWTFGSLSNPVCALENQEWPVHTATYLPKWSWRLINTCNPFLCRVSKWDFKSCAKPHASRWAPDSRSGGEERERFLIKAAQKPMLFSAICIG